MKLSLRILSSVLALALLAGSSFAQDAGKVSPDASSLAQIVEEVGGADSPGRLSSAIEIAVILTVVTLLPSILMTVTSFMRIMIVLSFVRRAMGTPELPPNQVMAGLALFLTLFVMYPVGSKIYDEGVQPYMDGKISMKAAGDVAAGHLGEFMLRQTRESDLALFTQLAEIEPPESPKDIPLRVLVPSFILSELKTSFQMGFVLFLPFLVLDLVISSILLSMGMFMLPPVVISTPLKILLFVLVDGWNLLVRSLVASFA